MTVVNDPQELACYSDNEATQKLERHCGEEIPVIVRGFLYSAPGSDSARKEA